MSMLRSEGVSMHFGGLKAVENVDLSVNEGEILSLIGPNGAGKTHVLQPCERFSEAHEGTDLLPRKKYYGNVTS